MGSLCWLNGLLEIWRVMHFVGFLFAFLGFLEEKKRARLRGFGGMGPT